jgi:hypothetical protein
VQEKFTVFEEKLFGDGLNIKGLFNFFQGRVLFVICQDTDKTALCGVAVFILTDQK